MQVKDERAEQGRDIRLYPGEIDLSTLKPEDVPVISLKDFLTGQGRKARELREACRGQIADTVRDRNLYTGEAFRIDGTALGCAGIVFAVEPKWQRSRKTLPILYRNCLGAAAEAAGGGHVNVVLPLLGIGSDGWTRESSMQAAWDVFWEHCESGSERIDCLSIYCGDEALCRQYGQRPSLAFIDVLRLSDDKVLWRRLRQRMDALCPAGCGSKRFLTELRKAFRESDVLPDDTALLLTLSAFCRRFPQRVSGSIDLEIGGRVYSVPEEIADELPSIGR